jgi:hypothetical protein
VRPFGSRLRGDDGVQRTNEARSGNHPPRRPRRPWRGSRLAACRRVTTGPAHAARDASALSGGVRSTARRSLTTQVITARDASSSSITRRCVLRTPLVGYAVAATSYRSDFRSIADTSAPDGTARGCLRTTGATCTRSGRPSPIRNGARIRPPAQSHLKPPTADLYCATWAATPSTRADPRPFTPRHRAPPAICL